MKYSCVDQVLPSPFQKEQEIMKSPNPLQMAGRREGWRTSARLAWSVATCLLSVDDLSFTFIFKLSPSTPPTQSLSLTSAGAYNGCTDFWIVYWYWWVHFIHADFGEQKVNMCVMLGVKYVAITEYISFTRVRSGGFFWLHIWHFYQSNKSSDYGLNKLKSTVIAPFKLRFCFKPEACNRKSR